MVELDSKHAVTSNSLSHQAVLLDDCFPLLLEMFLRKHDPFQLAPGCSNSATTVQQLWDDPDCQCLHLFLKKIHKPGLMCLPSASSKQVEDPTVNALIMPIWFARHETGASKLDPCRMCLWNSAKFHGLLLLQGDPVERLEKLPVRRKMLQGDAVSALSLVHRPSVHFNPFQSISAFPEVSAWKTRWHSCAQHLMKSSAPGRESLLQRQMPWFTSQQH